MWVWLLLWVAGAIGVLVGTAQAWVVTAAPLLDTGGPTVTESTTGRELAAAAVPAAWAALAGVLAVIATRGLARRVIGVLVLLAGLVAVLAVIGAAHWVPAAFLALGGGLLIAAAGAACAWLGGSWPALGRRYGTPTAARSPWEAIDAGEDPTAGPDLLR